MRRRVLTPGPTFLHRRVLPPKDIIVVVLDEQGIGWVGAQPFKSGPEQEIPKMPFWTYFLPNPLPSNS
jgi:hypothetical protein